MQDFTLIMLYNRLLLPLMLLAIITYISKAIVLHVRAIAYLVFLGQLAQLAPLDIIGYPQLIKVLHPQEMVSVKAVRQHSHLAHLAAQHVLVLLALLVLQDTI